MDGLKGAGWDEAPGWMREARARARAEAEALARAQMARRGARLGAVPDEVWAEAGAAEGIDDKEEGDV